MNSKKYNSALDRIIAHLIFNYFQLNLGASANADDIASCFQFGKELLMVNENRMEMIRAIVKGEALL